MSRSKLMAHTRAQGEIRSTEGLPVVNPHAASADIGAQQIYICLPGPAQTQIVRSFGTYTADLHAIADWLVEHGIQTIAMESTGVYWIPSSRSWKAAASIAASSAATSPAASPPVTKPMSSTVSGFKPCIAWGCSPNPSVPTPTSLPSARCCAIAPN